MTLLTKTTRWSAAAALGLALACLLLLPAAGAAKPRPMYWGAWIGNQLTGEEPPWDMSAVSQFEGVVHKGMSLLEFSAPFSDCAKSPCTTYPFPTEQMQRVRNYGAIPFFSWNSGASGTSDFSDNQLADINSGSYDAYIRQFATDARDWGSPFFLRFNWEMNGSWFPWSEGVDGNGPGEYVAAWHRVHDIFTSVGATNATWVWCPYGDAERTLTPMRQLYPGSAYVDWTCLDGFNWGANESNPLPWRSFANLFRVSYEHVVNDIAPDKPMILAETASNGNGRAKAAWIQGMFKQIATNFRRIRGVIWFNQFDRDVRWPLETSVASGRAFSWGVRKHPYRANHYARISASPIRPPR
jgi:hypothetical protein